LIERLLVGRLAALDSALHLASDAQARSDPDGVLAPPGDAIGARLLPVVGLLHADEFDAGGGVDRLGAAHGPLSRRPAGFIGQPTLADADGLTRDFDEGSDLDGRRSFQGSRKRDAGLAGESALGIDAHHLEAGGAGRRLLNAGAAAIARPQNGE